MVNKKRVHFTRVALLALLFITSITTHLCAVPAKPRTISVEQPDGTTLNIIVRGDEHFSWRTTESGYPIIKNQDGYYYYAQYSTAGQVESTTQRVAIDGRLQSPPSGITTQGIISLAQSVSTQRRATQASQISQVASSGFPSEGSIKSVVILVQYTDVSFSIENPNEAFWNHLNQEGYSVSGATGSARDYFTANSRGVFDGQFDVYGPYTLANERSYYGGNDRSGYDTNPDEMVTEGVALADADGVDFSQYDCDGDGYIDNVFIYYAGHNEAEGADEDTVWPHKWVVSSRPTHDGKRLYVYACTSELRDNKGTTIAGIGTFCHEFSHVFGLDDHYDTDGDSNGYSYGLGCYDIMTYGSYNNDGNTPPMLNALELDLIGWATPTVIESDQEITLDPIKEGVTYKILTDTEDEYFLLENRQKASIVWDNYIGGQGLIISHVDRSSKYLSNWSANAPNADTSHECFKFVVAANSTFSIYDEDEVPYPYKGLDEWTSTSTPAALSWSGSTLNVDITNITQNSDGTVSFSAGSAQPILGSVTDTNGNPIENAIVDIVHSSSTTAIYQSTTNKYGIYEVELLSGTYKVTVSAPYHKTITSTITVSDATSSNFDFVMEKYSEIINTIEVEVGQTSATVAWNPLSYTSFSVTISSNSANADPVYQVDDCQYTITDLEPGQSYNVFISVTNDNGDYIELYETSFTTIAKLSIPLMHLAKYQYSVGDTIELSILNSESDDTISWTIDGVATSTPATLTAGQHTIKATIVRGSDTYQINKIIYVE